MPYIQKMKKKPRDYTKRGKNKEIAAIYNTSTWKDLRTSYIMEHPLCEVCLKKGLTVPSEEVHHIKYISSGTNNLEMQDIAYNPDNLIALCTECHHKIHNNQLKLN